MTAFSQNGYPALDGGSHLLHTWVIPTNKGVVKLRLRNGSAGFLLAHWALRFSETIEPLPGKVLDDWGYAYRPIRGRTSGLSNHASGTAADFNATRHPLGRVGTYLGWQGRQIRADMGGLYQNALKAGLFYHGRKDPMHFEVNMRMAQAERVAKVLMNTPRGERVLHANPEQKAVILS